MASYRELKVWQEGVRLAIEVYRVTATFPTEERYGLVSQLRRAAVSVPSNIAEGHGRNTANELIRFCGTSLGSLAEAETQLYIAAELGYLDNDTYSKLQSICQPVGKMLHGLIRSTRGD